MRSKRFLLLLSGLAVLLTVSSSADAAFKMKVIGPDGGGGTQTFEIVDNVGLDADTRVGHIAAALGVEFGFGAPNDLAFQVIGESNQPEDHHTLAKVGNAMAQFVSGVGYTGTYLIQSMDTDFDLGFEPQRRYLESLVVTIPAGQKFQSWYDPGNNEYASASGGAGGAIGDAGTAFSPFGEQTSQDGQSQYITASELVDPFSMASQLTIAYSGTPIIASGSTIASVPEPGTLLLAGLGLPIAGFVALRRRKKKKNAA